MKSLFFSQWTKSFRKHKPVSFKFCINFSAIKHNSSILFLAQALHTVVRSCLLKCKFLGFLSAQVKICQIPRVNFELTSQFLIKFCIILRCQDTKLLCKFWAQFFFYFGSQKDPIKVLIFRLSNMSSGENLLNYSCHFWKHKLVFLQMLHQYSVPSNKTSAYLFLAPTLYTLFKRGPLKGKFLGFSSARVKFCQIPHVSFELTSQFLFKFCITLHCHDTKLPCKLWAHTFSTFDKRIPSKSQFLDFQTWSGDNLLNSSFLSYTFFTSNIIYFVQNIYTEQWKSPKILTKKIQKSCAVKNNWWFPVIF